MASPWALIQRDAAGDITSVPHTFSSWNNCMQKSYCKWPAIAGIIIASLIVVSVIWCLARCLCCGLSCCCSCLSCLSCCDNCCPGGRRRNNRSKYADQPSSFPPSSYHGYQPAPAPPAYAPTQFATFDAPSKGGKIHEDSLPPMPSWDNAQSRRVEERNQNEDVEMGQLDSRQGQRSGVLPWTNTGDYREVPRHAEPGWSPAPRSTEQFSPVRDVSNTGFGNTGYESRPYPDPYSNYSQVPANRYEPTAYQNPTMSYNLPTQPGNQFQMARKPVQGSAREV